MNLESEVFKICVELNKRDNIDIFLDFMGHVDKVEIKVILGGWKNSTEKGLLGNYTKYSNESDGEILPFKVWKKNNLSTIKKFSFKTDEDNKLTVFNILSELKSIKEAHNENSKLQN